MIPTVHPLGGVDFFGIHTPEERLAFAKKTLERVDFEKPSVAFSRRRKGVWGRVLLAHDKWLTLYHLALYCALNSIDVDDVAIADSCKVFIFGQDKEQVQERKRLLHETIGRVNALNNRSTNHGGTWPLLPDFQMFADYKQFYPVLDYGSNPRDDIFLVFAREGTMEYLDQYAINPIGWAIWKYMDYHVFECGLHPYWTFVKPDVNDNGSQWTGNSFNYVVRMFDPVQVENDRRAGRKTIDSSPAFMFRSREAAYGFRTFLTTLGLYDEFSNNYFNMRPVPIFPMSLSSTSSRGGPVLRSANFITV